MFVRQCVATGDLIQATLMGRQDDKIPGELRAATDKETVQIFAVILAVFLLIEAKANAPAGTNWVAMSSRKKLH